MRLLCPALLAILMYNTHAIDLVALRTAARTTPLDGWSRTNALYDRFSEPLPTDLLAPLCGNGRLDTRADYPANFTGIWVDEVCDDGNRLDGDGCAADCASMDAWTSPCPLALNTSGESVVALTFANASTVVIFTPTRRLYFDAITLTPLHSSYFAIGPVATTMQRGTDFFVYGGGRVWMPLNASWTPILVRDGATGEWLEQRYLVTAAGDIVDLERRRVANWTTSAHDLSNAQIAGTQGTTIAITCFFNDSSTLQFHLNTLNHSVVESTARTPSPDYTLDPTAGGYPWIHLLLQSLMYRVRSINSPSSARYGNAMTTVADSSSYTVGPLVMSVPRFSARNLLIEWQQFAGLGDPILTNYRLEKGLCNGTQAPCVLDTPLCYDILAPTNVYAAGTAQSLYTAFTARTAATLPQAFQQADIRCPNRTAVISQLVAHPVSQALWAVRGTQVFEIGRRGTQRKTAEQCLPSIGAACPAGSWSPPRLGCIPCSQSAAPDAVAAQQCPPTNASRRLLAANPCWVALTMVSNTYTTESAAAAFLATSAAMCNRTVSGGIWRHAFICRLTTLNPSATIRSVRAAMVPGVTDLLSPPSLVCEIRAPSDAPSVIVVKVPPTQDTSNDTVALAAGVAVGCAVVLAFLVLLFYRSRRRAYIAVSQQSGEGTHRGARSTDVQITRITNP